MHARARDGIHPCRRVRDVRVDDARARGDSHRPIRVDRVEGFPARAPESRSRWIGRRDITQRRPRIAHQRTILLVDDVAGSLRAKARGDAREDDGGRRARARARSRATTRGVTDGARRRFGLIGHTDDSFIGAHRRATGAVTRRRDDARGRARTRYVSIASRARA